MGPPHEGSIRRPIAPWANALTTELHLVPVFKKPAIIQSVCIHFKQIIPFCYFSFLVANVLPNMMLFVLYIYVCTWSVLNYLSLLHLKKLSPFFHDNKLRHVISLISIIQNLPFLRVKLEGLYSNLQQYCNVIAKYKPYFKKKLKFVSPNYLSILWQDI